MNRKSGHRFSDKIMRQERARTLYAPRLVIMAKSPRAGRVKRRLGISLGTVAATQAYRTCLAHTVLRLSSNPRWRTILAVTPDTDRHALFWPSTLLRRPVARLGQGGGSLGDRMQRLFADLPPGPVIIVGGDIPAIGPANIARAFRLLGANDAVFGPATDGGFWLVGLKRIPRLLARFRHVRWSGPQALSDTLANLKGKRVALVATLSDMDRIEDYREGRDAAQRLIPSARKKLQRGRASEHGV